VPFGRVKEQISGCPLGEWRTNR